MTEGYRTEMALRAVELLGDGKWHSLEETIVKLRSTIPPGPAMRSAELERRLALGIGKGEPMPPRRFPDTPLSRLIQIGQRTLARNFLTDGSGFEVDPGVPGNGREARVLNAARRIRMVAPPRAAHGNPNRIERDQLKAQIEHLSGRVAVIGMELDTLVDQAKAADNALTPGVLHAVAKLREAMDW